MPTNHFVAFDENMSASARETFLGPLDDRAERDSLNDFPFGSQYRIGLIPVKNLINQSGSSTAVLANVSSAFVLPLTWKELLVRIRAEVGQTRSNPADKWVRFGAVTVNFSRMEARRSGKPVVFSALQYKVLQYFVENPGRVISRGELLNKVWGYDCYPSTRTVDNILVRLRQAVESDPTRPTHFQTVHGTGYRFVP